MIGQSPLVIRRLNSSRLIWLGKAISWAAVRPALSQPHSAVIDLARHAPPCPRHWSRYPRGSVEFGILGPLEVRSASGEVPIRRGLPRTILIALVLRRGQTVASDFLVDLLWADE